MITEYVSAQLKDCVADVGGTDGADRNLPPVVGICGVDGGFVSGIWLLVALVLVFLICTLLRDIGDS